MVPMSNIPTGFGLVVYAAAHACGGSSVEAGVAPLTHAQFGTQCPFLNPPNAYIICVPPYHLCGYVGPPPPPASGCWLPCFAPCLSTGHSMWDTVVHARAGRFARTPFVVHGRFYLFPPPHPCRVGEDPMGWWCQVHSGICWCLVSVEAPQAEYWSVWGVRSF